MGAEDVRLLVRVADPVDVHVAGEPVGLGGDRLTDALG